MRKLDSNNEYYNTKRTKLLPIPVITTAPEAIRDKKYSYSSDVWSFGGLV